MTDIQYHIPALLQPTIDVLNIRPDGIYIDATMGGAGHTRAILSKLGPDGRLLAFDRDTEALENAPDDPRLTLIHSDFRYIPNFLQFYGIESVDGILADLGVSFHHFDDASRGFSFRSDSPLDMRMNSKSSTTAASFIADSSVDDIREILKLYTDLPRPDKIAHAIDKARQNEPVETTFQLAEAVDPVLNPARRKKELAQVFQAFRIIVNDEMGALRCLLLNSLKVLRPGGVLAILTYHSMEDRLVKLFMRSGTLDGKEEKDFFGKSTSPWKNLTKNGITADAAEIEANPRSRSARLRAAALKEE